ncbi:oxidoreductase [Photobacterium aquae]|uniref:Oxidoreductase n=1 Tax=Photobacterium aquae TaxID=1195763 RepID=A0A0J1H6G4_9GAMM|nr:ferric reductase-like transmembrane domain-containing protein [Photobacterium aquae]KLV07305.1 oxidoreductase [Photobacterium aquae]
MFKFTAILTLLWLPNILMNWDKLDGFFPWRHQLTMYSGLLGLGYMSLTILLAMRFRWVEKLTKGLDKGYQLHKKLGIGATISLFCHWLIVKSGPWLVETGILSKPNRGPRPEIDGINWHLIAEQVGDISFKLFLIFVIISLVQAISYKKFKFTHKLGAILMLAGIFHTVFLLDWNISAIPMNIAIASISAAGIWCSWLSLSGKIGRNNKANGTVKDVKTYSVGTDPNTVVRFSISLDSTINYKEGQFAYLDFHDGESPHPFSILNFNTEKQLIEFGVKDLGDYTHELVNNLKAGQKVTVEGGYGAFQIPNCETQVWVGAGIGIVPFISRLYWLADKAETTSDKLKEVHLFYCVSSEQEAFFHKEILAIIQHLDFIKLHLVNTKNGECLDSDRVMNTVECKNFDICFCGPQQFGNMLKAGLGTSGISENRFRTEFFKMR